MDPVHLVGIERAIEEAEYCPLCPGNVFFSAFSGLSASLLELDRQGAIYTVTLLRQTLFSGGILPPTPAQGSHNVALITFSPPWTPGIASHTCPTDYSWLLALDLLCEPLIPTSYPLNLPVLQEPMGKK